MTLSNVITTLFVVFGIGHIVLIIRLYTMKNPEQSALTYLGLVVSGTVLLLILIWINNINW